MIRARREPKPPPQTKNVPAVHFAPTTNLTWMTWDRTLASLLRVYQHVALTRRTNGRSMGTFYEGMVFRN